MKSYLTAQGFARILMLFLGLWISTPGYGQPSKDTLLSLLGFIPARPPLHIDTLETVKLDKGRRYKIRYLSEKADTVFHAPADSIQAYLFIPAHKGHVKLPAIVAIHQDGPRYYMGKAEPAGLMGDTDQHYGRELFERGYVVICPDRFYHARRRRIPNPDTLSDCGILSDAACSHWIAQLLMKGRTSPGKEVYDLMLTTDVLCSLPEVDTARIGAIGHSGGGYALGYFMFADSRIKAGASSCGVFELMEWFDEHAVRKRDPDNVIPGLARVGKTSDYIGYIAPRPFLMTRGLFEWGNSSEQQKAYSRRHVDNTKLIEQEAGHYYKARKTPEHLRVIYFDEAGGYHAFPPGVKETVYSWLDHYLKS